MDRQHVQDLMNAILERQGRAPVGADSAELRDVGFRSLDFSELALRVEDELGVELNFEAPTLRAITKVSDVLDFFEQAG
jgi:acyl carrier protein